MHITHENDKSNNFVRNLDIVNWNFVSSLGSLLEQVY